MKKKIFYLCFMLCCCANVFSQATSLTIDCQTPGWLASYINPAEAQNIRSLTVTGVINSTDLATIGNLVKNYQLNERLNLENVDIEGNKLSGDMFGVTDCQLQYLSLPLSVTKLENCVNWAKLDTLVCGSDFFPVFRLSEYLPKIDAKHLILREGVKYYDYSVDGSPIEEIVFPNSLKYIELLSGSNLSKINIPSAVEHLGPIRDTKLNLNGDTLYIPNTVKCLYDEWGTGGYRNGDLGSHRDENGKIKCVYLPEGLDTLWVIQLYGYSGSPYTEPGAKVNIHIKAKTPPRVQNATLGYNTIVYVPVGYKDVYKNTGANTQSGTGQWGGATIMEEVYAEQIEINAPELLYVGDSQKLKADFTPYNTSFTDVTWKVSNKEILSLIQDGTCTALSYGTVQVSAINADRSCTDTKTIKIYNHATGINISKSSLKLKIKEKSILVSNTLPLETSDGMITWSTSDELVATVDENGNVRGVGRGTCTITATAIDGGYTATCQVTVTQPVEALTLEKHSVSLKVGETEKLFAQISPTTADDKTIIWSSSNEQTACVDASGNVNALKGGEAWIKAVSVDNSDAKDSCKVIVAQPVTGIQLDNSTYQLNEIGESFELKATIAPDDASNKNIKWKSSDESVCVVSQGLVVAVGNGTCVITATTEDGGYTAYCTVNVTLVAPNVAVEGITLSPSVLNFKRIGGAKQIVANVLPADATNKGVNWTSATPAVCSVSDAGVVTSVGVGAGFVIATTVDGNKMAYCTVNVTPTDHTTITMGSNGIATFSDEDAIDFTSVSGVKAYIASGYNPATGDLTMTRVYKVPAGEGLLVKGAAGSYEVPYEETSAYYANLLVGVSTAMTVNPTDGDYTNFILANDEVKGIGFYPLASAGEIGANKAYLQLPTSILPAASRSLRMVFEDEEEEVTGIKDLNEKGAMRNEKFFDLQGRRVVKPTRGLYIKDGKKIMVK